MYKAKYHIGTINRIGANDEIRIIMHDILLYVSSIILSHVQ